YNSVVALAVVNLELYSKVWQVIVQMKRDIYGARLVTAKDVGDQDAGPPPDKGELQPAVYHQWPPDSHLEVIHYFNMVGVFGLDSWREQLSQACLTKRIPYSVFRLTYIHTVDL
ncbi:MAG: hypothetical protein ACKPKO_18740, partial [Candidatus Fonsibacter sp.]